MGGCGSKAMEMQPAKPMKKRRGKRRRRRNGSSRKLDNRVDSFGGNSSARSSAG